MKSQKTGSVGTESVKFRVRGLTPRFSPRPGVLDLQTVKEIAKLVWEKVYLIGKRQEIIIVTNELDGQRVVLRKGSMGNFRLGHESPYPGYHPEKGDS